MSIQKDVRRTNGRAPGVPREDQPALRPAVDIFENGHTITLLANLPGVSDESLVIEVEDTTLTIEGEVGIEMPDEMRPLHADVRATRYRRAFTLSNELDTNAIQASLKDGLLTLTIPKREEVRPRKIEVSVH